MDIWSDVDKEKENQRAELEDHQHLNARGILARTPCQYCPHSVPCPFRSFLSDLWRHLILRIGDRPDRNYPRCGNACTTCACLSPTPGFFNPFYYCQCLCPYGQRCSDTNDGRLNEGWSLHKMYICTFYALFNLTKACGSVLVWNTGTTCIFWLTQRHWQENSHQHHQQYLAGAGEEPGAPACRQTFAVL